MVTNLSLAKNKCQLRVLADKFWVLVLSCFGAGQLFVSRAGINSFYEAKEKRGESSAKIEGAEPSRAVKDCTPYWSVTKATKL